MSMMVQALDITLYQKDILSTLGHKWWFFLYLPESIGTKLSIKLVLDQGAKTHIKQLFNND